MADVNNSQSKQVGDVPECSKVIKPDPALPSSVVDDMPRLCMRHVLGFNGAIVGGLVVHPLGNHVVYAVGRHIIIEDVMGENPGRQEILVGHSSPITALSVSMDGQYIVSGQRNSSTETRSPVILWDWCTRRKVMERELHRETTAALAFTCFSRYFISLGCAVDGNICVWDTSDLRPLISQSAQVRRVGPTNVIAASHGDASRFVSLGQGYGRSWCFDADACKLTYEELRFGYAVRNVICAEIADKDFFDVPRVFCGTSTGTVLIFHCDSGVLLFEILSPKFSLGITALTYVRMMDDDTYCFLVGTGSGKVGYYTIRMEHQGHKNTAKMETYPGTSLWVDPQGGSCVTSVSKLGAGQQVYVGLQQGHMHRFTLEPWGCKLVRTCSNVPINGAAFARATDELLVTAENEKVRVYNLKVMLEVRRFVRVGRNCVSVCIRHDGTHIFTGWDDGGVLVLGFEPQGFGLYVAYRIDSAHRQTISCMALTSASETLVTGGMDSYVSVWRIVEDLDQRGKRLRQAVRTFQLVDQKGPITGLIISRDDQTCISTSLDGTATAYSLVSGLKMNGFTWTCGLTCLSFGQTDVQFVTASNDGRLQWWDVISGANLREINATSTGGVHSTDTEPTNRQMMATAGDDRLVKVWRIQEGDVIHVGEGHSGEIHLVKFGPCGTVLLSAAKDGSVCLWDVPQL